MNHFNYDDEYCSLKRSIKQFRRSLLRSKKSIDALPANDLIDLMGDIVAIKELINEELERELGKITISSDFTSDQLN